MKQPHVPRSRHDAKRARIDATSPIAPVPIPPRRHQSMTSAQHRSASLPSSRHCKGDASRREKVPSCRNNKFVVALCSSLHELSRTLLQSTTVYDASDFYDTHSSPIQPPSSIPDHPTSLIRTPPHSLALALSAGGHHGQAQTAIR